jgi:Nucleotide-diphospho-sugar transferase
LKSSLRLLAPNLCSEQALGAPRRKNAAVAVPDLLQSRDAAKPLRVRAAAALAYAARRITRLQRRTVRRRAAAVVFCAAALAALGLVLVTVLSPPAILRGSAAADYHYATLPSIIDPAYDRDIAREFRITLVVPAFTTLDRLAAHLAALRAASYDNEPVTLDMLLAPDRATVNGSLTSSSPPTFNAVERNRVCAESAWTNGPKRVRNATSAGQFDLILDAWIPARGDTSRVLLIDASRAKTVTPQFYRYLKSARARYRYRATDIAGFALEPVPVRASAPAPGFQDVGVPPAKGEDDVFLYAALPPAVGAFAPYDADVWRAFRNWFNAHRSEWFLWPVIVGAKDKNDPAWNQFRGTMRAHWTLWFSRFASEYGVYTLYPRSARPQPLPPIGRASANGALLLFDHYGRSVKRKLSISQESMRRILELGFRGGRGSVSMTVVNKAFLATAHSWVCNVDTAGIRPPGVVWITTDIESRDAMRKVPHSETVYLAELQGGSERGGTSYGTPGYWLLMLERTRLIREILDHGVGVFAFETDQIWLRDPVPHVDHLVHGGDEVDIVGTMDTRHEIGGNFLYLSPTPATKRLWRQVSHRFERAYMDNQMHKRTHRTHRYMENDQSLLTKLVFFDETFKQRNPVVFRALDTEQFVDGRWYKENENFYQSARSRSPILVNNNFLVGIEAKILRAKKHGHWFLESARSNGNGAADDDDVCAVATVHRAVIDNEIRMLKAVGGAEGDNSHAAIALSAARAAAAYEADAKANTVTISPSRGAMQTQDGQEPERRQEHGHQQQRLPLPSPQTPHPLPPPPQQLAGDLEAGFDLALSAIESEHRRGGG